MAWAGQPQGLSGSGGPGLSSLPLSPPPAVAAAPLPFPGMQPRYLLSPPHSSHAVTPASTPGAGYQAGGSPLDAAQGRGLGLLPEASAGAATAAAADAEQLQSMLSALRVALGKKEAALVSVAGQLAEVQSRLQACEAERRGMEGRLHVLQLETGAAAPERLPAAASLTPEGRLLAQARQELGQEAARAAELAAERDALAQDVVVLQQQLLAAAQVEAKERERLCNEATQSRLLARARARQVEQLQAELHQAAGRNSSTSAAAAQQAQAALAEAERAKAAAADASTRAGAAEARVAELEQQLHAVLEAGRQAEARAARAHAEAADAQQQMEWQALRIAELEQTSSVGQLMRKYEAEVQRLRAQFDAERRDLQEQLAQAWQQQEMQQQRSSSEAQGPVGLRAISAPQQSVDSTAWAALFDEPCSQQQAAEACNAGVQTESSGAEATVSAAWSDPALLEAARLEIECLQHLNSGLLESHAQAQHAVQDAVEQQREAALAQEREAAARQAEASEHQLALDSARRTEEGLRQRLSMAEQQLKHQSGEIQALREANDKLELAVAALKEELGEAAQAPQQELEQLQAELRQAVAHTDALETQVQLLQQAAEAAQREHEAAAQQQAQQGALDAAAQVAAAVQAAEQRQQEQVEGLQARLAEAHHQLQAARSEVSDARQEQMLRMQSLVEQGVQACGQTARHAAAVQTDAAGLTLQPSTQLPAAAPAPPLRPASPLLPGSTTRLLPPGLLPSPAHQWPTRASSACESPVFAGGQSPGSAVAYTAKQLQLELARVRIAPLQPLAGGTSLASVRRLQPAPSRMSSACGELAAVHASSQQPLQQQQQQQQQQAGSWGSSNATAGGAGSEAPCAGLAAARLAGLGEAGSAAAGSAGGSRQGMEDDEDACYATPLAGTPTSLSVDASPYSSLLSPGAPAWAGEEAAVRPRQPQQAQQAGCWRAQLGPAVPALDLGLVQPYTSLSCDSSTPTAAPLPASGGSSSSGASSSILGTQLPAEKASTTVSSLSSLGPSASQLASWAPPAAAPCRRDDISLLPAAGREQLLGSTRTLCSRADDGSIKDVYIPAGSSWQAASLDASLARLAALTAGLRQRR